jgi:hypothetical protein
VLFAKPVTVQLCAPVGAVVVLATRHVSEVGVDVTVYVEATPSATKLTVTAFAPALATVGVPSAPVGVTAVEAGDDTVDVVPPPVGATVKVTEAPVVKPETVQLCLPVGAVVFETEQVKLPVLAVTT